MQHVTVCAAPEWHKRPRIPLNNKPYAIAGGCGAFRVIAKCMLLLALSLPACCAYSPASIQHLAGSTLALRACVACTPLLLLGNCRCVMQRDPPQQLLLHANSSPMMSAHNGVDSKHRGTCLSALATPMFASTLGKHTPCPPKGLQAMYQRLPTSAELCLAAPAAPACHLQAATLLPPARIGRTCTLLSRSRCSPVDSSCQCMRTSCCGCSSPSIRRCRSSGLRFRFCPKLRAAALYS